MSKVSKVVFMAFMQHYIYRVMLLMSEVSKVNSTLFTEPLPFQEERLIVAFSPVGLAVHQSVRGGSFVNFLGLVKIQG